MPSRRLLSIAIALVVLLTAVALWTLRAPRAVASTQAQAPAAPPAPTVDVVRTPAIAPPTGVAMSAAPAASVPSSLAAQVDALAHTGKPADAMQAYTIVLRCLLARRRAHAPDQPPDDPAIAAPAVCGDLRSDQIQGRPAWLQQAALAGERGAAEDFIQEGPSGNGALVDLGTRDRTPPTAQWLAQRDDYIARALANCDVGLASYLGTTQRNRDTRQKALSYWVERLACNGRTAADTTALADDPQAQAYLDGLVINAWRD